jgi:hypothetical protein
MARRKFDLTRYHDAFDEWFPRYKDSVYTGIHMLVDSYRPPLGKDLLEIVNSADFRGSMAVLQPLIAIRNYKSQTPFLYRPRDLVRAIELLVELSACKPGRSDPLSDPTVVDVIKGLLELDGFRLATVSAVCHFCHPKLFPIVDINIQAACLPLKSIYPDYFEGLQPPRLPADRTYADSMAIIERYREFKAFIDAVMRAHSMNVGRVDYRFIDKAMMVIGANARRATKADRRGK